LVELCAIQFEIATYYDSTIQTLSSRMIVWKW